MKTNFNLQQALTANRDMVINTFNKLTNEKFYDNVTLKQFMIEVMNACIANNFKSEKTMLRQLPYIMGDIYVRHSKVTCRDIETERLTAKYQGTAYMALV